MAVVFARLAPHRVGMEACGGAHDWARKLKAVGHTVRLIAPQFIKPYVKSNENDEDAKAICEAVLPTCRSTYYDNYCYRNSDVDRLNWRS